MSDIVDSAFRRHYGNVYRFARRRAVSHEQAEDVAQDVFADAAAARTELRPEPALVGWLHTVAHRRLVDDVRRESRKRPGTVPLEAALDQAEPDNQLDAHVARVFRDALKRLPEGQGRVVVLKLLSGRSFAEIGAELQISAAASKMRFVRALETLREDLEREGIEP